MRAGTEMPSFFEYNIDGMLVDSDVEATYTYYLESYGLLEASVAGFGTAHGSIKPESKIDQMLDRMRADSTLANPHPTNANAKINGKWNLKLDNKLGFGKHRVLTLRELLDNEYDYYKWMLTQDMVIETQEIRDYLDDQEK